MTRAERYRVLFEHLADESIGTLLDMMAGGDHGFSSIWLRILWHVAADAVSSDPRYRKLCLSRCIFAAESVMEAVELDVAREIALAEDGPQAVAEAEARDECFLLF